MVVSGVTTCWEMSFLLEIRALQGLFYLIFDTKVSTFLLHYYWNAYRNYIHFLQSRALVHEWTERASILHFLRQRVGWTYGGGAICSCLTCWGRCLITWYQHNNHCSLRSLKYQHLTKQICTLAALNPAFKFVLILFNHIEPATLNHTLSYDGKMQPGNCSTPSQLEQPWHAHITEVYFTATEGKNKVRLYWTTGCLDPLRVLAADWGTCLAPDTLSKSTKLQVQSH